MGPVNKKQRKKLKRYIYYNLFHAILMFIMKHVTTIVDQLLNFLNRY